MLKRIAVVACISLLSSGAPVWADAVDAFKGKAYAQAMCASCHAIEKDDVHSPNPAAKPFASIFLKYETGAALADWVNTKHPAIPNSLLKVGQADDIRAYVASLKATSTDQP